jgi:hypothetical protein
MSHTGSDQTKMKRSYSSMEDSHNSKVKTSKSSKPFTETEAARFGLLEWLKEIVNDEIIECNCDEYMAKKLRKGIDLARKAGIESFMGFTEMSGDEDEGSDEEEDSGDEKHTPTSPTHTTAFPFVSPWCKSCVDEKGDN